MVYAEYLQSFFCTGCTGAMAYELTEAHPGLLVTVFDLPHVIEMRRHFQPRAHNDRVTFVAGQLNLNCSV